jgi:hypothetical protein
VGRRLVCRDPSRRALPSGLEQRDAAAAALDLLDHTSHAVSKVCLF